MVGPNWSIALDSFWRTNFHWMDITTEAPLPVTGSGWEYIENWHALICQATCLLLSQHSLAIKNK